ncbi:MAG: HypC/HybG/HupF family hydrogenase formation chaperone [Bacteroidota bacterium]
MCLAIPGKLVEIVGASEPLMGTVVFGGVKQNVCLAFVPDVKVGEYVLVHVGFAINTMDETEANKTLQLLREMDAAALQEPMPDVT